MRNTPRGIVGSRVRRGRMLVAGLVLAGAMGPALSGNYVPMTRDQALAVLAGAGGDQRPDLRNRDFRGQDLSGVDFKGADLFGTHLHGVPLKGAKLARTNLDITILRGADLEGADLRGASIFGVVLVDANLKKGAGTTVGTAVASNNIETSQRCGCAIRLTIACRLYAAHWAAPRKLKEMMQLKSNRWSVGSR